MPATTGSILVDRKKNRTSVHFFTGRIDSAYAAGNASSSTSAVDRMLAVRELSSGGQGPASKNDLYPSRESGANTSGGFFAASFSWWKEVRTIHSTGRAKRMPMTQAAADSSTPLRGGRACRTSCSEVVT